MENGIKLNIRVSTWKVEKSIKAYIPKDDRLHFLHLIGRDTSKLERNKFKQKNLEDGNLNGKHDGHVLEEKKESEEKTHDNNDSEQNVENENELKIKTSANDNRENNANDENELSAKPENIFACNENSEEWVK